MKPTHKTCQKCKGTGGYWTKLPQDKGTPWKFAENNGLPVDSYVACDVPGCHNGTVDIAEHYRIAWGIGSK